MARPLRIQFAGALYHVISRGNDRKAIVRDDADREKRLHWLQRNRPAPESKGPRKSWPETFAND